MNNNRARYVWDYDLTQAQFDEMLAGRYVDGHLDQDWAAIRIIEWAKYKDMVRLIGFPMLVMNWHRWRERIRSKEQRRSIDFLVAWLPKHHPELLDQNQTMEEQKSYYLEQLYPLQDKALQVIHAAKTPFYLTGGTPLSRLHLQHRYSDDLDLFVNHESEFLHWVSLIIDALATQDQWHCEISIRQQSFARLFLTQDEITLKIEMVNDVPSRVGDIQEHPTLGRIDTIENIFANKISALVGRDEPRDLADIWGLCIHLGLSLEDAIEGAHNKAAGIYPPDLAQKLCNVTEKEWELVRWTEPPPLDKYLADLNSLGESLLLGQE